MRLLSTPGFMRFSFWIALALSGTVLAQGSAAGYERRDADVIRALAGRPLADARTGTPEQAVAAALRSRGRDAATIASLTTAGTHAGRAGMTHLRLEQTVDGLMVYDAYVKAAFNRSGELVHLIDHLAAVSAKHLAPAGIDALQALRTAMAQLHPGVQADFRAGPTRGNTAVFEGGAFFHTAPTVTAVAIPLADGSMMRGWLVETWTQKTNQLHHTLVGGDGRVLDVESRTANDSYNVFTEYPGKTPQAVVTGPGAGNAESQAGWLGSGTQTTINITGNNANAYLDTDANNAPDSGGTTVIGVDFLTAANLATAPSTTDNRAVAVQNLFYLNNVIHDILYRHGFDEAAGNFQVDNFGQGGLGNDPVLAEAQDGSDIDNGNFATPADGSKPRMQMYLWTGAGATHEVVVGTTYGAMGAVFGPALSTTGVTGTVVASTPEDGCKHIGSAVSGKVALIARGTCDFTTKVLNAQRSGAIAVIVTNNVGTTEIFTMGGSNTRINISSVMISQNDGNALRALSSPPGATLRMKAIQPLQLDGSLDSDIVYHEYCHGLTWRMIGGMSGPLAGAVGEGMSDGCSLLINQDDVIGEYAASNPLGIRRYPYDGYPLTYRSVTGSEVHDDGEVYAAIVWKLLKAFGVGRTQDLFTHIVDGMNFTPSTPKFENMRDGILAAVAASTTAGDRCTVWAAFASSGVGVGAKAVIRGPKVVVTESLAMPSDCP